MLSTNHVIPKTTSSSLYLGLRGAVGGLGARFEIGAPREARRRCLAASDGASRLDCALHFDVMLFAVNILASFWCSSSNQLDSEANRAQSSVRCVFAAGPCAIPMRRASGRGRCPKGDCKRTQRNAISIRRIVPPFTSSRRPLFRALGHSQWPEPPSIVGASTAARPAAGIGEPPSPPYPLLDRYEAARAVRCSRSDIALHAIVWC